MITRCDANGPQFKNIMSRSIHRIVTPPEKYINGDRGVWIQGIREPVKVLNNEFIFVTLERTK
jgi:hypothetical protein